MSLTFAFGLSVLFLLDAGHQTASAASCKQLGRQLASLKNTKSGSPRYRRAVKKQQQYINQVKRQLRSHNCRRKALFGAQNKTTCDRLQSALGDMQGRIKLLRKKAGGPRTSKRSRRRLKRAMRRKGCGNQQARKKTGTTSIIKQIFGDSARKKTVHKASTFREELEEINDRHRTSERNRKYEPSEGRRIKAHGRVKTLCVRTCDGYFFPVGFSTEKGKRVPDADACSNSCPGTEMALYYRQPDNENPKSMISVNTGKPYTELPTAFAYRKRFNPSCSCNFRLLNRTKPNSGGGLKAIAGVETNRQSSSNLTTPVWRADRGQDPETIANIGGGWTVKSADQSTAEKNQLAPKPNRPIRVVGDTFFPGQ